MSMEIVTGYHGIEHVRPEQVGRLLAALVTPGQYVIDVGSKFEADVQTANLVRIGTGEILLNGRHVTSEAYTELTLDSGTTGYSRRDLIVCRYSKDEGSGVETTSLEVIKGTPVAAESGDPEDPAHVAGDVLDGDVLVEMPLWRIPITDLTPGDPVQLFEVLPAGVAAQIEALQASLAGKADADHVHDAADIIGTLPVSHGGTGATSGTAALNALGIKAWLLANVFKVGYVWVSYTSTSPASIVGGTWTPIKGYFPYFNAGTGTGGANSHTLTVAQMPSHAHTYTDYHNVVAQYGGLESKQCVSWASNNYQDGTSTKTTGGGNSHNNMPSYQELYAWHRTA